MYRCLRLAQSYDSDSDRNADGHREHLDAEQYYTRHDDVSTRRDVIAGDAARRARLTHQLAVLHTFTYS